MELSKKREVFPDLAPILWHTVGTMAALLQVGLVIVYSLSKGGRVVVIVSVVMKGVGGGSHGVMVDRIALHWSVDRTPTGSAIYRTVNHPMAHHHTKPAPPHTHCTI